MDPDGSELEAISTLAEACAWSGVDGDLQQSLMNQLGTPAKIREIALINRPNWDKAISALKIAVQSADSAVPATERELKPVEVARAESLRRVCLLRVGMPVDHPGSTGAPVASALGPPAGPQGVTPGAAPASRRLKLASVVDPTLDAEIVNLTATEASHMYTEYKKRYGDLPGADSDPSPDQLAGLHQVVKSGSVPYADFSIFGPHGLRLLRRQMYTAYQLNAATGEWCKREQPGPPGFHDWYRCWKCFRCTMLLIEACNAERLDAYSEHIRSFITQFGEESWWVIYRADVRMRSEHLERIRRELRVGKVAGFSDTDPWPAVFAQAVRDHEFWSREVVIPATLWLANNKRRAAPSSEADEPGTASVPSQGPAKKARAKRTYNGEDKSFKDSSGIYTHNRKGIEICRKYNCNECGSTQAQGKCQQSKKRSHQCNRCLGPHQATACTKP